MIKIKKKVTGHTSYKRCRRMLESRANEVHRWASVSDITGYKVFTLFLLRINKI